MLEDYNDCNKNAQPVRFKVSKFITIGNSLAIVVPKQYFDDEWLHKEKDYLATLQEVTKKEVDDGEEDNNAES